jgi:hypothetical protein
MWWSVTVAALLAAALAWAGPTQVGCGPAQAGCGPAVVAVGGVTTTTLAPGPAPSWVPSMLGAWMLDESSGTRVNAQGTTARDLTVGAGSPSNSTDRMEGAASLNITATTTDLLTNESFTGLVALSIGCWVKSNATNMTFAMHDWTNSKNTFRLNRTLTGGYSFAVFNNNTTNLIITSPNSWTTTVWSHVVGTLSAAGDMALYVNGAQVATGTNAPVAAANVQLYIGDNATYTGLLDECVFDDLPWAAASVCRICSCGIRGEQCTCSGTAFASTGRNATACGSCTLPADCSAAAPS